MKIERWANKLIILSLICMLLNGMFTDASSSSAKEDPIDFYGMQIRGIDLYDILDYADAVYLYYDLLNGTASPEDTLAWKNYLAIQFADYKMEDVPDWLTGKLYLTWSYWFYHSHNTIDNPDINWDLPTEQGQYLFSLDFSTHSITKNKIPDYAVLQHDHRQGGMPLLIEQSFERLSYGYDANTYLEFFGYTPVHKTYSSAASQKYYVYELDKDRVVISSLLSPNLEDDPDMDSSFSLPCCFSLLGCYTRDTIKDGYKALRIGAYYLKYATAETGEMQIQMLRYYDGEEVVYHHFPIDYPWNFWKYAISDDGKIAWVDPETWRLYISDGESEIALPEDQTTNDCFTWLNDTTLIYLCNGQKGYEDFYSTNPLMLYHTDTGICEQVKTASGIPILLHNMMYDIAIDPNSRYLACIVCYPLAWATTRGLMILSLENGDAFTVPGSVIGISDGTLSGRYNDSYVPRLLCIDE